MDQALRPYASAGVALAGASLIAMTPVAGPATDIQARAVQLMSAGTLLDGGGGMMSDTPYPIATPNDLFSDTQTNLQALDAQFQLEPSTTPILDQVIANQTLYATELDSAALNAQNDLVSAIQGFPDALQQAQASGDLAQELYGPYSYVLGAADTVNHDLLNGISQVEGQVAQNFANLFNDNGLQPYATIGEQNVPIWLSELVQAGLYPGNAAVAGFAGVAGDVQAAVAAGDYSTAWSDLMNGPSTVADAFLNGYQIDNGATQELAAVVPDALRQVFRVPPEFGLLTGAEAARRAAEDALAVRAVGRGTIENVLLARQDIARDLGAERAVAELAGVHSAGSTDVLSGTTATDGLSTLVGDFSNIWSDLTALFDPSTASDAGSALSTDLSSLLLSLF